VAKRTLSSARGSSRRSSAASLAIFLDEGRVLRLSEAARRAEALGLNPTSATIHLIRSPVLQAVARGRYTLRGAVVPGEERGRRVA
jgi:hypothetical protein